MLAAGLGVALQQHLVARVQVQHLAADAAAPQFRDQRRDGLDLVRPVARVESHGGARDRRRPCPRIVWDMRGLSRAAGMLSTQ